MHFFQKLKKRENVHFNLKFPCDNCSVLGKVYDLDQNLPNGIKAISLRTVNIPLSTDKVFVLSPGTARSMLFSCPLQCLDLLFPMALCNRKSLSLGENMCIFKKVNENQHFKRVDLTKELGLSV